MGHVHVLINCGPNHLLIKANYNHVSTIHWFFSIGQNLRAMVQVRKVTCLECKFINDLFHIRDSIRTEFRVYEHNQSRIRRLYAFQARDFPHTSNATYR